MAKYNHSEIEKKWQDVWAKTKLYETNLASKKPKHYNLVMFPYPSGAYLHMGHGYSYSGADVYGRLKLHQGYNVFEPIGYDSFGLPAENYAIKQGVHPAVSTKANIEHAEKQLKSFGAMFDFSRQLATSDPAYYKWTQWLFLKLYEQDLAYQKEAPVNWCSKCLTVLANEQVIDGHCERCETEVEQKSMTQWFFKITDYADRLVADLDKVDWPESSVVKQRNWIGRSEGAEIDFSIAGTKEKLTVFTTRLDTIFGATYMVIAPEHEILTTLQQKIKNFTEIDKYAKKAARKTSIERADQKTKTGLEVQGLMAVNPFTGEEIPIFVSDYIVGGYGTGAIMAVPAHDERDWEFAKKFNLPIKEVIAPYWLDEKYLPDPEKDTEKREVVAMIVRDPKKHQTLCLDWSKTSWKSFPTGGIDGQDFETAARRELLEETGYKNLKFVEQIPGSTYVEFFRPHKGNNVYAHFHYLVFELTNDEKDAVEQREVEQHKVVWVDDKEVDDFLNVENQIYAWKRLNNHETIHTGKGVLINSGDYSGLTSDEAVGKMIAWLQKKQIGGKKTNYRLRDWSFSRQRYWGAPIPIVYCPKCGTVPVPERDLPVLLPEVDVTRVKPMGAGKSPLANIPEFVETTCPKCGGKAERETDTMDTFVCSSFYYLRYPNVGDDTEMMNPEITKKWLPVDMYVGGAEHVTMHLLYSRFVTKALYDAKLLTFDEPFTTLRHQGMILGPDGKKMSKSKGNVVIPDEIIREYGADIFRTYILFMGPFEEGGPWNPKGIVGARRFLEKIHDFAENSRWATSTSIEIEVKLNRTIKKVTADIENFKFNTAIAALMEFANFLSGREKEISKVDFEKFVVLLSPFTPHLMEEIWEYLGNKESVCLAPWPDFDEALTHEELIAIAVQVNGKVRDTVLVSPETTEKEVMALANNSEKVQKYLAGKKIQKQFYVKGKILSIVTNE